MNGVIIFNNVNDIVFKKFNGELATKIQEIARMQGLIDIEELTDTNAALDEDLSSLTNIDNNVILQIFSPIINSQKIMFCQFDNTYSSFQCDNGLNFAFGEFLGYAFLKIGNKSVDELRRNLSICISFTKHLCGSNLFLLQQNKEKMQLMNDLIDNYEHLNDMDQGILLEAMPQLITNSDIKIVVRRTLDLAIGKLQDLEFTRSHAVMFVKNKFVGSSSSRLAQNLSVSDILFISLLCRTLETKTAKSQINISLQLFLEGERSNILSGCIPCILHVSKLDKGVVLILIVEYGNLQVASSLYDTFFALQKILNIQMQGDSDGIKPTFENLEAFIKQSLEALKKAKLKGEELESSYKRFASKWDNLKKMYTEFFKTSEKDLVVRIESNMPGFQEELKDLFGLASMSTSHIASELEKIPEVCTIVEEKLLEFSEFLSVKAERNLSIESYLEEFPGLVHFIYLNRFNGTMIAPDLVTDAKLIPKEKIWKMVEFTRSYLRKGHTSIMWKDTTFNYSYFLWFEDQNTGSIKPINLQNHFTTTNASKLPNESGILTADYYQYLSEMCFPKMPPGKVKCYEIYCIHLGLVTATCAAEHCRRLVATIVDIIGETNEF